MKTIKISEQNIDKVAYRIAQFFNRNKNVCCQSIYKTKKQQAITLGMQRKEYTKTISDRIFSAEIYSHEASGKDLTIGQMIDGRRITKSNAWFFVSGQENIKARIKLIDKKTIIVSNKISFLDIEVGMKVKIGTTSLRIQKSDWLNKGETTTETIVSNFHDMHIDYVMKVFWYEEQINDICFDSFVEDESGFEDEFGNSAFSN